MVLEVSGILLILLGISAVGMILLVVLTASEDLDQYGNEYTEQAKKNLSEGHD